LSGGSVSFAIVTFFICNVFCLGGSSYINAGTD
jgi:hypothetical protein